MLHPSVEEHNSKIIQTPEISTYILPKYFALWRNNHADDICSENCRHSAVIIETTCISKNPIVYDFTIVSDVQKKFGNGSCIPSRSDMWFNNTTHKILIQRPSSIENENNKIYSTEISYYNHYVAMNPSNIYIPVVLLKKKCLVLDSRFINIEDDINTSLRFILRPAMSILYPRIPENLLQQRLNAQRDAELAAHEYLISNCVSKNSVSNKSKPHQRIINGFIENLVHNNEICPVTFDKLVCNKTYITDCGHSISFEAMDTWLKNSQSCPVCRASCSKEELQTWKE